MRIRWTPAAAANLQRISDYLKKHHPRCRQPAMRKVYEAIGSLKQWPQRGRIGREEGHTGAFVYSRAWVAVYFVNGLRASTTHPQVMDSASHSGLR